jgi:hypothetical protein
MIYAQAGHGRRATLYTDYTFAVRDGAEFVPFTKAYSGLTDAEFSEITRWIRKNTLERFGPVRRVAAGPGVRDRVRGDTGESAAQVRGGAAVSADAALAAGQAGGGGQHAGRSARDAGAIRLKRACASTYDSRASCVHITCIRCVRRAGGSCNASQPGDACTRRMTHVHLPCIQRAYLKGAQLGCWCALVHSGAGVAASAGVTKSCACCGEAPAWVPGRRMGIGPRQAVALASA